MAEETALEFRWKKIDETRNYLLNEIKHNDLISENILVLVLVFNYVEHLIILVSTVTGCV